MIVGDFGVLRFVIKKLQYRRLKVLNDRNERPSGEKPADSFNDTLFGSVLEINLALLKKTFHDSNDLIIRRFEFIMNTRNRCALAFINNLIDNDALSNNVLKPLMNINIPAERVQCTTEGSQQPHASGTAGMTDCAALLDVIAYEILSVSSINKISSIEDVTARLLSGSAILILDGCENALEIPAQKWEKRQIEEPQTESVVRGPREGFVENINYNRELLRRKLKDPDLCFESLVIGDKSRTEINVVYLKSVASSELIDEIMTRLKRIKIDAVLESGYIEQLIEDAPYSIFSTIANSEKPDKVAAKILEGRVAILADGSPFVLTVPMLFMESFQSVEDYYSRPYFASFVRLVRITAYFISVLAPAAYVALTVYHQELIPTELLISITSTRRQVPFPAIVEALLMTGMFDILREAGVRLPKPVGPAVSIVGALVLGQSAVQAGLVSPIMIIVVAATAICSFTVPPQTDSGTILRYFFLTLAGVAGGFGVIMGFLATTVHLLSLRSFGTPYMSPVAPFSKSFLKDTFIRLPLWSMINRPAAIEGRNAARMSTGQKPSVENPGRKGQRQHE